MTVSVVGNGLQLIGLVDQPVGHDEEVVTDARPVTSFDVILGDALRRDIRRDRSVVDDEVADAVERSRVVSLGRMLGQFISDVPDFRLGAARGVDPAPKFARWGTFVLEPGGIIFDQVPLQDIFAGLGRSGERYLAQGHDHARSDADRQGGPHVLCNFYWLTLYRIPAVADLYPVGIPSGCARVSDFELGVCLPLCFHRLRQVTFHPFGPVGRGR